MRTSILDISAEDARKFFLRAESYSTIELPEYFQFQPIIDAVDKGIGRKNWKELKSNLEPKSIENVNFHFIKNKDGRYAWRPMQIIHPVMYVSLVNLITETDHWIELQERFKYIRVHSPSIECLSIPLYKTDTVKKSYITLNWWEAIELYTQELSLEFSYMLNTDIVNCYGSVYTHTIPWALYGKENVKQNVEKYKKKLGGLIDSHIQSMSYQQTNGIPQGSVLMDLIAEIILAYSDLLLYDRLEKKMASSDYHILRYRDDYRIFTKSKEHIEIITKELSDVLACLNFKLNSQKTFISEKLIIDSVKPDKLFWIKSKHGSNTLQKHLLLIHMLATEHPNSGSLDRALAGFYGRIRNMKRISEGKEHIKALIGILIDIAHKNPRTYPCAMSILGCLLSNMINPEEVLKIIDLIKIKFSIISDAELLNVWLQRICIKVNPDIKFDGILCANVAEPSSEIWNSDWLQPKYKAILDGSDFINRDCLSDIPTLVPVEIVNAFTKHSYK